MSEENIEKQMDILEPELLNKKSNQGGAREGAGRPRGSMSKVSKSKAQAERELRQRIVEQSQRILDKQLSLAEGCQYLMVTEYEIGPKGGRKKIGTRVVEDKEKICMYLDGELDNTNEEYYFITTERPNARVLDSLLDRAFGKATNNVDMTSGGKPLENIKFVFTEDNGDDGEENTNQPETETGNQASVGPQQ